ncbi:MAG: Fe-S-containing hydro-lyase [Verrucomicrobiota bacterium]
MKRIQAELDDTTVESLNAGDQVLITGVLYTARDAAHKRFVDALEKGEDLPVDLRGRIIYYTGPTPAKPGHPTGSAGPTTSGRMDAYTPALIQRCGLKGMIGKGKRSARVVECIKQNNCVYFAAIGGAGALIARSIKAIEAVCYQDLGPEAVHRIQVVDFPAIVATDSSGTSAYPANPQI